MDRNQFGITDLMVQAARALVDARAHEAIVKPQVQTYQRLILAKHRFMVRVEFRDEPGAEHPITDPEKAWLMSDADLATYIADCHRERDRLGLVTSVTDGCPLLEAKARRTEAEWQLFDVLSQHPRLGHLKGANQSVWRMRQEALDLAVKFMMPFLEHQDTSRNTVSL